MPAGIMEVLKTLYLKDDRLMELPWQRLCGRLDQFRKGSGLKKLLIAMLRGRVDNATIGMR